jgi:hypothetical protein
VKAVRSNRSYILAGGGFLGFMFATAFAALVPSTLLLATPFLCSGTYGQGVVDKHYFSYGLTSGRSVTVGCSDGHGNVHSASTALAVVILFVIATIALTVVIGAIVAVRSGLRGHSGSSDTGPFSIGETVKLTGQPVHSGVISEVNWPARRVKVLVSMWGKDTVLEVAANEVEKY